MIEFGEWVLHDKLKYWLNLTDNLKAYVHSMLRISDSNDLFVKLIIGISNVLRIIDV